MTPFEKWIETWVNKPKDLSDREKWIAEAAFIAGSISSIPRRKAVEHRVQRTGLTPYDMTHFTWRGLWAHFRYFLGISPRR